MPRTLSQAAFRALFAQETGEVFLCCLTLTHASWPAPLRVVLNNQSITRTAGTFQPALFDISMPEESSEKVPEVTLTFDNVDKAIADLIRTITGRVKITMEIVLASSPNTIEAGPFEFYMLSCSYDAMTVQGKLGFEDDILNTEFPADKYTPLNSPGVFR